MSGKREGSILIIDDEKGMREFLEIFLGNEGYNVKGVATGKEAIRELKSNSYDLIVVDLRLEDMDGLDVLREAKRISSDIMAIIISAYATADTAVEAMKRGAYDYLPKPFDVDELLNIVDDALHSKDSSKKLSSKKEKDLHFGCLIGESPQMHKIYELIEKAASTKSNVLISGESGTGKELVARAIHFESNRKNKPFVVINCAGIPETLLESELFGYKKGAFTGAISDKEGLFDVAHGGTVFFDEIGELPMPLQAKLLRVIQERRFKALGGVEEKEVDVRFISATNKDLEKEVIEGRFREDLFFRLNVIHIHIPPLREREGDIPLLANHFLKKYSEELGKEVKKISTYALTILKDYPFPGNVRELENIIERGVALESSNIILPESLTLSNMKKLSQIEDKRLIERIPGEEGFNLDEIMNEIEKSYIEKALDLSKGSKARAADLLGISPDSLKYRIKKLGLDR